MQTFALSHLAQHRPAAARPYMNKSRPLAHAAGHRVQLAWELVLAGMCDVGEGSFAPAARLLEQATGAARQVGDTMVELFAWASLATAEFAAGDLRRTAAIEASFASTDAFTGPVEPAITALSHVASAMTDPGHAARALLDLAGRPIFGASGDHIRYQLAAATLLFQVGDLRAAENTLHDALSRCEAIGSPLAGACRVLLARIGRADGNQAGPRRWPTRGWPRSTAPACGPSCPTPSRYWAG